MRQFAVVLLMIASWLVQAEDTQWFGIVKSLPGEDRPEWAIGSEKLTLGVEAERKFDVGPLVVGACAEVDATEGVATSVRTRPMSKCDVTDYEMYFSRYRRDS